MISPRKESSRDESPILARMRRDRATPQFASLFSSFLICAAVAIVLEIIGWRLQLPKSVTHTIIIIAVFAMLAVAVLRVTAMNRRAEKARREAYRQKLGIASEDAASAILREYERKVKSQHDAGKQGLTYEDAGVSIDTKYAALDDVKSFVRSTYRPEVLSDIGQLGHFGGLFALDKDKYDDPVFVSSADSVGTKLKVAFMMGKHDTVGFDIVAHCGNDIVVLGAEPLFFLDYIGTSKVDRQVMTQLIDGLARGCRELGCALIGGETAELPAFYQAGEYDLVGFIVGVVERQKMITGDKIRPGDCIIGLASAGLHTNGFSLARKVLFEVCRYKAEDFVQTLGTTVGDELLKPHKSYVRTILKLIGKFNSGSPTIKGIAHITGGGLLDNVPRILPENCCALIEKGSWKIPPVFPFLQEKGNVPENEMYRVFNMGIGMVVIVSPDCATPVIDELQSIGETVYSIGKVVEGNRATVIQ